MCMFHWFRMEDGNTPYTNTFRTTQIRVRRWHAKNKLPRACWLRRFLIELMFFISYRVVALKGRASLDASANKVFRSYIIPTRLSGRYKNSLWFDVEHRVFALLVTFFSSSGGDEQTIEFQPWKQLSWGRALFSDLCQCRQWWIKQMRKWWPPHRSRSAIF